MSTDIDYIDSAQEFFTYAGYYINEPARIAGRCITRLYRAMPEEGYWQEAAFRAGKVGLLALCAGVSSVTSPVAFGCYFVASIVGKGGFELVQPATSSEKDKTLDKEIKVMNLNACMQDPWSELSGGIVSPFTPVGNHKTRIEALVEAIAKEDPDVFVGQEFENLAAQDEFIRLMQEKGYKYFLRDTGANHCIYNNSGLLIASKVPFENVEFVPYPSEDREGLASWSAQGALAVTVKVGDKELKVVDVHLNYGGKDCQGARDRQIENHVAPLLNTGAPSILLGDLNFNTKDEVQEESKEEVSCGSSNKKLASLGLVGYTNVLEDSVTCTDEGKHTLNGKERKESCEDCGEKIDGFIYKKDELVESHELKPLLCGEEYLTDHFATIAVIQIKEKSE